LKREKDEKKATGGGESGSQERKKTL